MLASDIATQRLARQHLIGEGSPDIVSAVRHLVASQSQDVHAGMAALGLRVRGATEGDVSAAFDDGRILRTHVLRPTWHFILPEDLHWLVTLSAPRVQAVNRPIYRRVELDDAVFAAANASFERALDGGKSLTRDALREVLTGDGISFAHAEGNLRMICLLMNAELHGLICSGPRIGKQVSYALARDRGVTRSALARDEAMQQLVGRYFDSRGPATIQDFVKWSSFTVADTRRALGAIGAALARETIDGVEYFGPASPPAIPVRPSRAHLLSVYDEYVSSYRDHSTIADPGTADRLKGLGNALTGIIVLDGRVAGTWKRTLARGTVTIGAELFRTLTRAETTAVKRAAEDLARFLGVPLADGFQICE